MIAGIDARGCGSGFVIMMFKKSVIDDLFIAAK